MKVGPALVHGPRFLQPFVLALWHIRLQVAVVHTKPVPDCVVPMQSFGLRQQTTTPCSKKLTCLWFWSASRKHLTSSRTTTLSHHLGSRRCVMFSSGYVLLA